MTTTDPRIDELADILNQTRDMCGCIRCAVKDWEDENGRLTTAERAAASQLAWWRWNDSLQSATDSLNS